MAMLKTEWETRLKQLETMLKGHEQDIEELTLYVEEIKKKIAEMPA